MTQTIAVPIVGYPERGSGLADKRGHALRVFTAQPSIDIVAIGGVAE